MTTNVDACVTRLQEQVHQQARFGLVELPRTEAVEHKPLTEARGRVAERLSFQTGAIDVEARCDRGMATPYGRKVSCKFWINTATMACAALTARVSLTGALRWRQTSDTVGTRPAPTPYRGTVVKEGGKCLYNTLADGLPGTWGWLAK